MSHSFTCNSSKHKIRNYVKNTINGSKELVIQGKSNKQNSNVSLSISLSVNKSMTKDPNITPQDKISIYRLIS